MDASNGTGIMQRLKESTQSLHDATEAIDFQTELVAGKLPRELYVRSLEQLLLIHRALEGHLRRHADHPAIARVVREYQYQEPYLLEDLEYFGVDAASIQALAETQALIDEIDRVAASDPAVLLGYQYVFEGSNNGGRFIAMKVRRAYGLTDGAGTRYLDPYGTEQRERWQAFRADMDRLPWSTAEQEALIAAAQAAFRGIAATYRGLYAVAD